VIATIPRRRVIRDHSEDSDRDHSEDSDRDHSEDSDRGYPEDSDRGYPEESDRGYPEESDRGCTTMRAPYASTGTEARVVAARNRAMTSSP
jgi:hypothetical protein